MKLKQLLSAVLPKKENTEPKVECAIDDEVVDCQTLTEDVVPEQPSYTGVPAPAYLEPDPWFGGPILSEKSLDVVNQEAEIKRQEKENKEELIASGIILEEDNIHQRMYEIASKNWNTVAETQGGSENFQSGPGGWNSSTGMRQFL
jgi:hypothetical protein